MIWIDTTPVKIVIQTLQIKTLEFEWTCDLQIALLVGTPIGGIYFDMSYLLVALSIGAWLLLQNSLTYR